MKGYSFSREDVDARSLANQYAQSLGQIFTHEMKPMEVEILVAEIGYAADGSGDQLFHILYDGTVIDEDISVVLGGETEAIAERLGTFEQPPPSRMGFARPSLRSPGRNARSRRHARGRRAGTGRPSPNVPTARRPRDHRTARLRRNRVGAATHRPTPSTNR